MFLPHKHKYVKIWYNVDEYRYKLSIAAKHRVPLVKAEEPECDHTNGLSEIPPCRIEFPLTFQSQSQSGSVAVSVTTDLSSPKSSTHDWSVNAFPIISKALSECARNCYQDQDQLKDKAKATKETYLHIIRDPRNTAVSSCIYRNHPDMIWKNNQRRTDLKQCISWEYPMTLLWTKYREILLQREELSQKKSTVVCYEQLTSASNEDVLLAYRQITTALSLTDVDRYHSAAELNILIANSSEKAVKSRIRRGEEKFQTTHLRGGGDLHFTSRAYGLNTSMLIWMNETYRAFEQWFPSPCQKYRIGKGLV